MSEAPDRIKLMMAEEALVDLTDECGGSCAFNRGPGCVCTESLWPAIAAIRAEIAAQVKGGQVEG